MLRFNVILSMLFCMMFCALIFLHADIVYARVLLKTTLEKGLPTGGSREPPVGMEVFLSKSCLRDG